MNCNKSLLTFAIVYNVITLYFVYKMTDDPSSSIGYIFILPSFWIVAGIILGILFWTKLIKQTTKIDDWLFIFSTPLPIFGYMFLGYVFNSAF